MTPEERRDEKRGQREALEADWQAKVDAATAVLETNSGIAGVRFKIHQKKERLKRRMSEAAKQRLTPERLKYFAKILTITGKESVNLVTDLDSQKAFAILMYEAFRHAWYLFSGEEIEDDPFFWQPVESERQLMQKWADSLHDITQHWIARGNKRVDRLLNTPAPSVISPSSRRGYRQEVNEWMKANNIDSLPIAAIRLGCSHDSLKSIMSTKGKKRYGKDTLQKVLTRIGVITGHPVTKVVTNRGHQ